MTSQHNTSPSGAGPYTRSSRPRSAESTSRADVRANHCCGMKVRQPHAMRIHARSGGLGSAGAAPGLRTQHVRYARRTARSPSSSSPSSASRHRIRFFQTRRHSSYCSGWLKSSQVKSSQVKSSQVKSSQVKSSQVKSSQVKSSQVKSSQVKSSQVKSCMP